MNVGVPDLAVDLAWASTSVPLAGQSFTLTATVRNQGPDEAGSTTLRFYRSDDEIIDATDTPIGIDAVSRLTGFNGLSGTSRSRRSICRGRLGFCRFRGANPSSERHCVRPIEFPQLPLDQECVYGPR